MAEKYVKFVPRLSRPTAGNKYYITVSSGGYSHAIKGKCRSTGKPDPMCDTLANCVGYAYGRFNEIGGYGYCKYLKPVDAGKFIDYCGGLPVSFIPSLGACAVWSKDGGAGHVAIVEKVINAKEIVTSESGYNANVFWTSTRVCGNGNWGQSSAYHFLGFIQNPAVKPSDIPDVLGVDGEWGQDTSYYTQIMLGTRADKIISAQKTWNKKYLKACLTSSWKYDDADDRGSDCIKALQRLVGVKDDGICGEETVRALQTFLRELGYYKWPLLLDGRMGKGTVKAWQRYVNAYFKGLIS